jgi:hypothetical protein
LLVVVACVALVGQATRARADVITDVNSQLINIIQNTSASLIDGPPEVANEISLVDSAMFDAVNAATGSTYGSVNYTGGPVAGADANAAALQAALTVMNNLYVNPSTSLYQQYEGVTGAAYYGATSPYKATLVGPTTTQMAAVLSDVTSISDELAALGDNPAITTGISLGTATGNAAILTNTESNTQAAMLATLTPYTPPNEGQPGVYVPPSGRPALQPTWGGVSPLGMPSSVISSIQASIPGPQPLTSQAYALEVLQTECQGAGSAIPSAIESVCAANGFLPEGAEEAQAALFWNDPGGTAQPPGHWLQIADTVATSQDLDLLQTARATALVGIALEDAGIATWGVKFADNTWRPITAIQDCSNWSPNFTTCDSTWTSLIATPPHPDYIAGHPAFSGAAATALADAIGTDNVTFTSTSQNYCNGGSTTLNSDGNVIACTLNSITYTLAGAGCANGGTPTYDSDGNIIGCTLDGVGETVTGGGCNNADSQPVLNQDGTANPLYNGSPLICSIAETFSSLSEASSGYLGAEFSRVVGGIHTPDAVTDALSVGNQVGAFVSNDDLPEPPMAPVLAGCVLLLGVLRHRHIARAKADAAG